MVQVAVEKQVQKFFEERPDFISQLISSSSPYSSSSSPARSPFTQQYQNYPVPIKRKYRVKLKKKFFLILNINIQHLFNIILLIFRIKIKQ
jgi:hypothetical protein